MKLYIIRHGQTEWNLINKIQGWKNSNLTEKGMEDARKLGEKLQKIDFDYIYTSNQGRAIDTARLIRGKKKTEIIEDHDLQEIRLSLWEGMTIDEISKVYPEDYDTYMNRPDLYKPSEGESYEDLYRRINKVLKKIISCGGKNILIVTHGVSLKIILAIIKNIPLNKLSEIPVYPGTALNICKIKDNSLELILEGDTSHMD